MISPEDIELAAQSIAAYIRRTPVIALELVSDEAIQHGQRALWDDVRIVAEPSAAACVAVLLEGLYRPLADERVGIVICGGNVQISLPSD